MSSGLRWHERRRHYKQTIVEASRDKNMSSGLKSHERSRRHMYSYFWYLVDRYNISPIPFMCSVTTARPDKLTLNCEHSVSVRRISTSVITRKLSRLSWENKQVLYIYYLVYKGQNCLI